MSISTTTHTTITTTTLTTSPRSVSIRPGWDKIFRTRHPLVLHISLTGGLGSILLKTASSAHPGFIGENFKVTDYQWCNEDAGDGVIFGRTSLLEDKNKSKKWEKTQSVVALHTKGVSGRKLLLMECMCVGEKVPCFLLCECHPACRSNRPIRIHIHEYIPCLSVAGRQTT